MGFRNVNDKNERLFKNGGVYDIVKKECPEAETYMTDDAEILVAAYGAAARIAKSAVNAARKEGIKAGLVRPVTLWPYPDKAIKDAAKNAKKILVTEMSMGQMVDDVKLAVECRVPVHFYGRTGGVVPTPAEILGEIRKLGGVSE